MSNYTKKKLGLIFLSIGFGLVVVFFLELKEKSKFDFTSIATFVLVVGILFVIASIVLFATIPSKNSIYEKGKRGYCTILKFETSRSTNHYGCSFYFLVEYKTEDGAIKREGVKCSKEDIDKYKSGTKLFCYIKGNSVYVPRPFKVIEQII